MINDPSIVVASPLTFTNPRQEVTFGSTVAGYGGCKWPALPVCCRQHDPGPPDKLARRAAVGDQSLKFSTVGGAKVNADIIKSHAQNLALQALNGNPMSGGQH